MDSNLQGLSDHRDSPKHADWSGLSFPFPEDISILGIEPASLVSPALVGSFFTTSIFPVQNM